MKANDINLGSIVKEINKEADNIHGTTKEGRVGKHTGACAVDIIKEKLENIDEIKASAEIHEEFFVEGFNAQFDLLMVKKGAKKITHRCFKPDDVLVAFEIKYYGFFSHSLKENGERSDRLMSEFFNNCIDHFSEINKKYSNIHCIYITIKENESWRELYSQHQDIAFCLSWGEWERLIDRLKSILMTVRA